MRKLITSLTVAAITAGLATAAPAVAQVAQAVHHPAAAVSAQAQASSQYQPPDPC